MWVWGFGHHKWYKSHELKMSDLTRLLYHVWFPKPHAHICALTVLYVEQVWSLKNLQDALASVYISFDKLKTDF